MMALVRGVMAHSSFAGSMLQVSGSMSTKTGSAPAKEMASAVAMKVEGTVITSSASPTPRASRASQMASVPLPTPTAYLEPQKAANDFSNFSTKGPPAKAVLSITSLMAAFTSSFIGANCAFKSRKGTFINASVIRIEVRGSRSLFEKIIFFRNKDQKKERGAESK